MTYDNTTRGALFRNDKREADTDADYRGTVNIEGTECWLNGWLKTTSISRYQCPKEAAKTSKPRTYESRRDDAEGMGF